MPSKTGGLAMVRLKLDTVQLVVSQLHDLLTNSLFTVVTISEYALRNPYVEEAAYLCGPVMASDAMVKFPTATSLYAFEIGMASFWFEQPYRVAFRRSMPSGHWRVGAIAVHNPRVGRG